jgi:WD40 repeat protein
MPRVFLSYARTDGERPAAALRDRLTREAPDIVIQQDRLLLEGGIGWWKQITDAIDSVEFLILLMTPAAIASGNVQKEWRYARQQGVCVYPVKAAPDADLHFPQMPRWMSKAHFFDLKREWPTFLAHLRKGCNTPRVPFMAPDLPQHFVPRPSEYEKLKAFLLTPDRGGPVAITTGLSGAGGFGKTTLAVALCHDEDIGQNFDDGILWVTLGQAPDVLGALLTAYAALTGQRPGFASIEDAAFQLGEKLEERTCLLVIDDVWDTAHLRPFLRGGKSSARLFTTRDATIASEAASVTVDEMREAEAIAMLTNGVSNLEPGSARNLARRLGEWPLALELASSMLRERVRQGDSAAHAVARLLTLIERKGVRALEDPTNDPRHRTISNVLDASLELLDADARRHLAELSIFPEDVEIPLAAASSVWELDEFDTENLAQRLARLSVLKLQLQHGVLILHDVMRSWLASNLANRKETHDRLLNSWPDWRNLPPLPREYAWRWLPWHLVQAGRAPDLERILWDPQWMQAKLRATDVNALIADYEHLTRSAQLELLQGALRLSNHVLASNPAQFASQVVGRLLPHDGSPPIRQFSAELAAEASQIWLRPLHPALHPPGTALVRTFEGHAANVSAVAITPDGQRAVSASADNTLKVWDLETGAMLRTLEGHSDSVSNVAVTSDGRRAVSASRDRTLKFWELENGVELGTLERNPTYFNPVAITPDGKRVIYWSAWPPNLVLLDLETGIELEMADGHFAHDVAVSPDGGRVVSASRAGTLTVWDLEMGIELRTLRGHSAAVSAVAVTPDGRRAVSASADRTLKVWDLETGIALRTFNGHSASVSRVAVTPDGKQAVSASWDRTLKLWDLETGRVLRSLEGHSASVSDVAVTPDGKQAVSASEDKTLKLWNLDTSLSARSLAGHGDSVYGVAATPDRKFVVSGSGDHHMKLWDVESGTVLCTLDGDSSFVSGVAVTPDGKYAVSASADKTLTVWDLKTGSALRTLEGHAAGVNGVAAMADGKRVVSASTDTTLKIWDLETTAPLLTLEAHSASVSGVALTLDGSRAVSCSLDKTLKVWDLKTGVPLRTMAGHALPVSGVALTPDGRLAVSASWDKTLRIWDIETGFALRTLEGHTAAVYAVAVTPDGKRAVSASGDRTLKVWDLATGLSLATFHCDANPLCCIFVGGQKIIAGDAGGRLHFLRIEEPTRSESDAATV